jgi:site-specific recombinase XerD
MRQIPYNQAPKKLPKYLTKQEIDTILDKVNHDTMQHSRRNYIMLLTLWRTGIRVSELVHLKKSDLKEDTILIQQGKGKKDRVVPLSADLRNLLLTYADRLQPENVIFAITRRQVNNVIRRYAPGVHAHTFRHSFAVHYLKSGGNLRSLQLILGHTSLMVTQIYLTLSGVDVKEDYDKIVW